MILMTEQRQLPATFRISKFTLSYRVSFAYFAIDNSVLPKYDDLTRSRNCKWVLFALKFSSRSSVQGHGCSLMAQIIKD